MMIIRLSDSLDCMVELEKRSCNILDRKYEKYRDHPTVIISITYNIDTNISWIQFRVVNKRASP